MKSPSLLVSAAWALAGMPLWAQAASDRHPVYDAGSYRPTASEAETTQGTAEVCECSHARVIVTQREFPADSKNSVQLSGWRGERTSAQLAIRCSRHAPQLSVSCPGVQQAEGKRLPVQVNMVRYTAAHGMPV
ncbi:MAG: hypothetical protein Q4F45_09110, partial [Alistipes sp.]|nr:hypothetical protein [Alistipes sp.]